MSEIPEEVMMNAERLYDDGGHKSVPQIIAEAIMAERMRCIEIADAVDPYCYAHEVASELRGTSSS